MNNNQINVKTKKPYRGFNHEELSGGGYESNKWGTFLTWKDLGFSIKKGEKGFTCFHPTWKEYTDKDGETKVKSIRKYFTLFNEEQVKPTDIN